jgi:NAD(P)-dependent dehydrogenase (short-subunit alcohol dehydrogenase family)
MNPTYDFHDRVAVITGAGSGMGLATAQAFAESGAAVVLTDRNEQTLRTARAELTSAGFESAWGRSYAVGSIAATRPVWSSAMQDPVYGLPRNLHSRQLGE